jgi:hypothetical protein
MAACVLRSHFMRRSILAMVILCGIKLTLAGASDAQINGITRDCFGGKEIRPGGVDIYLIDPHQSPKVLEIAEKMHLESKTGDKGLKQFFVDYADLLREVRNAKVLGHVLSDKSGRFTFDNLRSGQHLLILGVAEREDEPAYHAYKIIDRIESGKTALTLDFNDGFRCSPEPA